jgi:hypothetical protein
MLRHSAACRRTNSDEPDFVTRVWPDANNLPSHDSRYKGAIADIRQHRINNWDWDDDWIFTDPRFNLMGCDDAVFLAFLAETVHPVVRSDAAEVTKLVSEFNTLRPDGYMLSPASFISGHPIYAGTRITASHTPATALKLPTRTLLDDHTPPSRTTSTASSAPSVPTRQPPSPAPRNSSKPPTSSSSTSAASRTGTATTSVTCTRRSPLNCP